MKTYSIFIVKFNVAISSLLARVRPHLSEIEVDIKIPAQDTSSLILQYLLVNACASAVLIEISFQVVVSHLWRKA